MFKLLVVSSFLLVADVGSSNPNTYCGDWTDFKNENCYKIIKNLTNYYDANDYCGQLDDQEFLAIIKTREEQDTIDKIIRTLNMTDNVWIGSTKIDGIFKNADQTELNFKHWADNRPVEHKNGLDCVEMSTNQIDSGHWFDQNCLRHNALICQKNHPWSPIVMQNMLLELKRQYEKNLGQSEQKYLNIRQQLDAQIAKMNHLEDNIVPIGFIYLKIFGTDEPKNLWPNTDWRNLSAALAGLFFRVEGGQASEFGYIQEQQTHSFEVKSNKLNPYQDIFDLDVRIGSEYYQIYSGGDYL